MINGRKVTNQAQLHAYSPQVAYGQLPYKVALYFISCDLKGSELQYSKTKLEAVKAYFDTLDIPCVIIVCDNLPRYNWKKSLREKDIDFSLYDELSQSVEQFHAAVERAERRLVPLHDHEEEIEALAHRITVNANLPRLQFCRQVFTGRKMKVIAWSDSYAHLPRMFKEHHDAVAACHEAVVEGARRRQGTFSDNVIYKQEELVVHLELAKLMQKQYGPTIAFYNDFSKQADQTGHMIACEKHGQFPFFDLSFKNNKEINDALIASNLIVAKAMKDNDPEKQLAMTADLSRKLQPSLQLHFVLELLQQTNKYVPRQHKFLDACIKLYRTLEPTQQLEFISNLLDFPRRKVAAYYDVIWFVNSNFVYSFGLTSNVNTLELQAPLKECRISSNPVCLFGFYDEMKNKMDSLIDKRDFCGQKALSHLVVFPSFEKGDAEVKRHCDALMDLLIEEGVDVHEKDDLGHSALYWAELFKNPSAANKLRKAGAKPD